MIIPYDKILALVGFILAFIRSILSYLSLNKNNKEIDFPFRSLSVLELSKILPSPLKEIPTYIPRPGISSKNKNNHTIIIGGSGIGKSREAYELIQYYSNLYDSDNLYYTSGYVEVSTKFPQSFNPKKVMIFIDDYDYSFASSGSSDYYDRESGVVAALANIQRLYNFFHERTELCCFIITINSTRLPISSQHEVSLKPFEIYRIHPIDNQFYIQFVDNLINMLKIKIVDPLRIKLKEADGRLDTISIFLSQNQGQEIDDNKITSFLDKRDSIWDLFKKNLSNDQYNIYRILELLNKFNITKRVEYINEFFSSNLTYSKESIIFICSQIWNIRDDIIITYAGQFETSKPKENQIELVCDVLLKSGTKLYKIERYDYQRDCNKFLAELNLQHFRIHKVGLLLNKLTSWYRRDNFFYLCLARHYYLRNKFFRSMIIIYRALRNTDPIMLYSGKYLLIKLHLLLAETYQNYRPKAGQVYGHTRIEVEYKRAIAIADLDIHDLKSDDFGLIYPMYLSKIQAKKTFETFLSELGLKHLVVQEDEMKWLRAYAHHRYGGFLGKQIHREYDALEQEKKSIGYTIIGESYIDCAIWYRIVGKYQDALNYINLAETAKPSYLLNDLYMHMVFREKYFILLNMGLVNESKSAFLNAATILQNDSMKKYNDMFGRDFLAQAPDSAFWKHNLINAQWKSISRIDKTCIIVDLHSKLKYELPDDWKIFSEFREENGKLIAIGFTSQVYWDDKNKVPINSSIGVLNLPFENHKSLLEYSKEYFRPFKNITRSLSKKSFDISYDHIVWDFVSKGKSTMVGSIIIIKKLPIIMIIDFKYLSAGKDLFSPIFNRFLNSLLSNPIILK